MFKKIVSSVLVLGIVVINFGFLSPRVVMASSITSATDTVSRLKASTPSNHVIKFTTPSGIAASKTVILTFNNGTLTTGVTFSDVTVTAPGAITVNAGAPAGANWGFVNTSSTVLTFTTGSGTVAPGAIVTITFAGTNKITNGTTGTTTLTITGSMADSGTISMSIVDDDQVSITATVNQTLTFDLDTGITAGETGTPYQVPLGVLTSGSVTHSDGSGIKQIFADGGTNASGGMNVTVSNLNGANGLASTSTPADKIPSATGTMAAGTPNYGLCVDSASASGFSRSSTYNTTCTLASSTNAVVGLTTTPTDILTSSAPVAVGHAQILVNAAISSATPAHTDYTDTLTFIASASF